MVVTPDLVHTFLEKRSNEFGFGDAESFGGLMKFKCLQGIQTIGSSGRKMEMDVGRHKYSVNTSIY